MPVRTVKVISRFLRISFEKYREVPHSCGTSRLATAIHERVRAKVEVIIQVFTVEADETLYP